ncbi:MAG: molecular chaperone TorD family protein [Candidatus Aminicenantes bacterium]|nr:MAG: molecular chaperone TorD family protein [Candidatus Aminicenantes bacterium]
MKNDHITGAEMALQRSSIYGLLSLLYSREPDVNLLSCLREQNLLDHLIEAGMTLNKQEFTTAPVEEVRENLAIDYTSLFIASTGKRIPLNESIHHQQEGHFWGHSTVEVNDFIRFLGMTIDNDWTGFPDHIAVEFEVMKKLVESEQVALEQNNQDRAKKCRKLQREFLDGHISHWVPQVCERIIHQAQTSFYKELAALTKDFIEHECQSFGSVRK